MSATRPEIIAVWISMGISYLLWGLTLDYFSLLKNQQISTLNHYTRFWNRYVMSYYFSSYISKGTNSFCVVSVASPAKARRSVASWIVRSKADALPVSAYV